MKYNDRDMLIMLGIYIGGLIILAALSVYFT